MMGSRKKLLATSLLALPGIAGALGLGSIEVKSGLNEPLQAEIQVILSSPEEKDGLNVALASPEDFSKVGLDFSRVSVPVSFKVGTNTRGQTVIEVSSKDAVREPFLSLLVEVNWSNGRLLREFSVLLDPPVMASARGPAASSLLTQPLREDSLASSAPLESEPVRAPEPAPAPAEPVAAAAPEPMSQPVPEVAPEPAPEPIAETAPVPAPRESAPVESAPVEPAAPAADQYGPTAAGDSLFTIAKQVRPGSGNADQLMVAILRANPQAFYQDNINALKKGAILRIPSESEYLSLAEAQQVARDQNALWRDYQARSAGNATLVSDAGAASVAAESNNFASSNDRLELAAPREGNEQGSADRPGSGNAGSAEEIRNLNDDLASAREELSSAQRESTELRSRVGDLEKLKQDQSSLISMKDDRIAELEQRLQQLEAAAKATPVAAEPIATPVVPEAPVAATPSTKIPTEDDIWAAEPAPNEPALPSDGTEPVATGTDLTVTPEPGVDLAPDSTMEPTSTEPAITEPAITEPVMPAQPVASEPTAAGTELAATSGDSEPALGFMAKYWMYLAGGAGLLGLLGFFVLRRKPGNEGEAAAVPDNQLDFGIPAPAPAFGSDQALLGVADPLSDFAQADPEIALRSAIESDPGNLQAHAELLSMFYERGDAGAFEDVAQAMFAHVLDPNGPEWLYVKDMGDQLIPDSPLFASTPDFGTLELPALNEQASETRVDEGLGSLDFDSFSATPAPAPSYPAPPVAIDSFAEQNETPAFDFDLNLEGPTKQIKPIAAPAADVPAADVPAAITEDLSFDFSFDLDLPTDPAPAAAARIAPAPAAQASAFEAPTLDLPSFDFDDIKLPERLGFASPDLEPSMPSAPSAPLGELEIIREPEMSLDDSLFGGSDDAVGTKLDLARAYLDMGDPDGARGMLEEVMLEGTDQQRGDAQELLARI